MSKNNLDNLLERNQQTFNPPSVDGLKQELLDRNGADHVFNIGEIVNKPAGEGWKAIEYSILMDGQPIGTISISTCPGHESIFYDGRVPGYVNPYIKQAHKKGECLANSVDTVMLTYNFWGTDQDFSINDPRTDGHKLKFVSQEVLERNRIDLDLEKLTKWAKRSWKFEEAIEKAKEVIPDQVIDLAEAIVDYCLENNKQYQALEVAEKHLPARVKETAIATYKRFLKIPNFETNALRIAEKHISEKVQEAAQRVYDKYTSEKARQSSLNSPLTALSVAKKHLKERVLDAAQAVYEWCVNQDWLNIAYDVAKKHFPDKLIEIARPAYQWCVDNEYPMKALEIADKNLPEKREEAAKRAIRDCLLHQGEIKGNVPEGCLDVVAIAAKADSPEHLKSESTGVDYFSESTKIAYKHFGRKGADVVCEILREIDQERKAGKNPQPAFPKKAIMGYEI